MKFPWNDDSTAQIYMKYPWGEKDIDYWYLFMDCQSRNMLALLGTTKPRIDEAESKSILGPWLTSLDITEFGIEDFDYSSGMCNHIYPMNSRNLAKSYGNIIWVGSSFFAYIN